MGVCRHTKVRGRKLNPNLFFSNFSGAPGISRQNPGISRPKSLVSLGFEGHTELLAPTQASRARPPPHPKKSGPKSLGLGSFFFPERCWKVPPSFVLYWNIRHFGLTSSCQPRGRKEHIKKPHINNFRGSQGGGLGGRFRGPNSLCRTWCRFSQQSTAHKEF